MKKGTKIGLGIAALLMGAVALSGCTNSFCSVVDKAHILYGIEHGVCEYYDTEEAALARLPEAYSESDYRVGQVAGSNIYYFASLDNCKNLQKIQTAAIKSSIATPSLTYYIEFDNYFLKTVVEFAEADMSTVTAEQIGGVKYVGSEAKMYPGFLEDYGFYKFYGTNEKESKKLFENWKYFSNEVRKLGTVAIDECPTLDYTAYYEKQLKNTISSYRSCLATSEGYYGKYGGEEIEVLISEKSWGYAWKNVGFLSCLLVYPIGWLIATLTVGFGGAGSGWAPLLAILFVTLIVRTLMLLVTFKQTTSASKMQELQPEVAKIQAKYPNSNTNNYEKQRLAQETQALYKKHKINPFMSIIVMIVQFPIFICVWGAMQGSAALSSGSILGLNLSQSISSVLTTWSNWRDPSSGVWTALVLFLLMSGAQTVAMLLPQWLAKAKKKKIAKLGRNPAQKESDNKTKWFTYIMLAMIIFMGFSLVSALGVYWLVGALFSVAQTLITHLIMNRPKKSKK